MYREILCDLESWKNKENRRPLLLKGAKGVGKSFVLRDFGEGYFESTAIFDFKIQNHAKYILGEGNSTEDIIRMIEVTSGEQLTIDNTLIVFENVDYLDDGIRAVKHVLETMSKYAIAFTISIDEEEYLEDIIDSLDVLEVYPLSFSEFLIGVKASEYNKKIEKIGHAPIDEESMNKIIECLNIYMLIGGMPTVVREYINTDSIEMALIARKKLVSDIDMDIQLSADKNLKRKAAEVFDNIVVQSGHDNKRFTYSLIKQNARSRDYEEAVLWLCKHKYIRKVERIKSEQDYFDYTSDKKSYRLFYIDNGILNEKNESLDERNILSDMRTFDKTIMHYIMCQLSANKNIGEIYYWMAEGNLRIDFVFEDKSEERLMPVSVEFEDEHKAESQRLYNAENNPPAFINVTDKDFAIKGNELSIPLFSIWNV